jgi:predicted TIM-barrel fold metal-dependent hydrolase
MESQALSAFQVNLRELRRPQVYVKLSALLRRLDGRVPQDLTFTGPSWTGYGSIFGENRLLYGNDWPNSHLWAQLLNIFLRYFTVKGATIAENFFWRNSVAAYNWVVKREATQPAPIVPD